MPLNHMYISAIQERVAFIGTTLVGLGRPSCGKLRRPSKDCGFTIEHSISGTIFRNMNARPAHNLGSLITQQHSKESSRGGKCPLDARKVCLFYRGLLGGILLEFQHPLHFVDRILMKTTTISMEGI